MAHVWLVSHRLHYSSLIQVLQMLLFVTSSQKYKTPCSMSGIQSPHQEADSKIMFSQDSAQCPQTMRAMKQFLNIWRVGLQNEWLLSNNGFLEVTWIKILSPLLLNGMCFSLPQKKRTLKGSIELSRIKCVEIVKSDISIPCHYKYPFQVSPSCLKALILHTLYDG